MSLLKRSTAAAAPAAVAALALYGSACGAPAPAPGAAPAAPAPAAAPAAPLPAPTAADWRQIPIDNLMVIDTSTGRVVVEMHPEVAPEHVEQIKTLVRRGFYDGLLFFRVIDDFMAQTGDSANTGAGPSPMPELKGNFTFRRGPEMPFVVAATPPGGVIGYIGTFPVHSQPDALAMMTEDGKVRSWGVFCTGVAGMARTQNPDSASSQFFLMRGYAAFLDTQYTPWGRVVAGQDVVKAIKVGEPPTDPDKMEKVRMAADMPAAERPNLWRLDPASAAFKAQVAAAVAAKGVAFTACDAEPPVQAR
jgi:peptidylprolyl isomerase